MENTSLVKIRITHRETGYPAVGYTIDIAEIDMNNEFEMITDTNGEVEPFSINLNDYIYLDVFVKDENGDMVIAADNQYKLEAPETIIDIQI